MTLHKLPPRFIQDCLENGCAVGRYAWGHLEATPKEIGALRARAEHYAHPDGPDQIPPGLKRAAVALLAALKRATL
jgi:hypothetical protein